MHESAIILAACLFVGCVSPPPQPAFQQEAASPVAPPDDILARRLFNTFEFQAARLALLRVFEVDPEHRDARGLLLRVGNRR